MPQYLFLLSIGPVQRFIAGARKTVDLFNSSRLLSDLTGCAVEFINQTYNKNETEAKAKIIYPQKEVESKPNRLVALIDTENPEASGQNIELHIRSKLKTIAENVYEIAFKGDRLKYPIETYNACLKQVENLLEIQWVFYLPEEDPSAYPKHHKTLESLLGSIKNARPFAQLIEEGRKCALTGEHNALFIGNVEKEERPAYFNGLSMAHPLIGKKETLGGVGLLKRLYHEYINNNRQNGRPKLRFPSITEITHLHLRELGAYKALAQKLREYEDFVDSEQIVYQLCLPESLREEMHCSPEEFQEIQTLHKNLYKELKEQNKSLTKYYALMMFDGDSMGKWLGAENCKDDVKSERLQEYHEEFSQLLGRYGKEATHYLDGLDGEGNKAGKALGKTVYAGGDDFLGFINLANFWETIKELRVRFEQEVNQKLTEFKKEDANLTFSAGAVIAHYKEPLQQVVELCRSQEKKAKAFSESKNALSVLVFKHGGEAIEFTLPWRWSPAQNTENGAKSVSSAANTIDYILELRDFFRAKKLSKNFIQTIGRMLSSLELSDPVKGETIVIPEQPTYIKEKNTTAENEKKSENLIESLFKYGLKRNPEKISEGDKKKLVSLLITVWQVAGQKAQPFIAILQTLYFMEREL
jgi:CRISPR-associated protein Cmr2